MNFFTFAKTVLVSLLKKPATLMYPVRRREFFPLTRGAIVIAVDQCIFCGLCSRHCPPNALTVTKAERKWEIDRYRCITCGSCVEVCPKKCLSTAAQNSPSTTVKQPADFFSAPPPSPVA